ncbi:MAG: hypothetical protein M0P57_14660 [Syntrophales bacterium]|jgi:hypothetical protein|nr:hypothetical protein [Syntrophales bacterium]
MRKEDLKKLEGILDVADFTEEIIEHLSFVERSYHSVKKGGLSKITRPADEKKEHKEVKMAAEKMLSIIRSNPDLIKILIQTENTQNPGSRLSFDLFLRCNEALVKGCEWFLANVQKDKGGRKDESTQLRILIEGLTYVYVTITGKYPTSSWNYFKDEYAGKFFELVRVCLTIIDPPPPSLSNGALGKLIQLILRNQQKALGIINCKKRSPEEHKKLINHYSLVNSKV